ncbi:MAG TPA: hypothetical protein VGK99_11250 [Acidobacteriota bacterium]|jgi:predicted RNA-binding Zn-ribbon protein involved in translation (DUF1610 family)
MERLLVTTQCPTCGGPLDFKEGTNALQCVHCRSNLLVTGHRQVLSYILESRIEKRHAVDLTLAAFGERGVPPHILRSELYFVPYYRFTAQDFAWQLQDAAHNRESDADRFGSDKPEAILAGTGAFASQSQWLGGDGLTFTNRKVSLTADQQVVFRERYVEKNYLAADLPGLGVYSLGVRPAALRLRLFQKEALEPDGKAVPTTLSIEQAQVRGIKMTRDCDTLYREVAGAVLSVIYFPFWIVQVEASRVRQLAIVDAVAKTIIRLDAPNSLYDLLNQRSDMFAEVIGLRPLVCPNCGWNLPVKAEDILFYCAQCKRIWQVEGKQLYEIAFDVAEVQDSSFAMHLPFWDFQADNGNRRRRFFIPAFHYRRLKLLIDLATAMSRKHPDYNRSAPDGQNLQGGYYDRADGERLARFVAAGLQLRNIEGYNNLNSSALEFPSATLTWFPFREQAGTLINPLTSTGIPAALLI